MIRNCIQRGDMYRYLMFLFTLVLVAAAKNYTNYHLLEVNIETNAHLNLINELEQDQLLDVQCMFPMSVHNKNIIIVSPNDLNRIKNDLRSANVDFTILNTDIQKAIDLENKNSEDIEPRVYNPASRERFLNNYQSLTRIYRFLKELNESFAHATLWRYGLSIKGNPLYAIKFVTNNVIKPNRTIFLEGGAHAREWITIASLLKFIERMAKDYGSDPVVNMMLNKFNWVFAPVANPDGYEFSRAYDRFWRKNRRNINRECKGVDLNRNFPVGWQPATNVSGPCSEVYPGTRPFSEPETKCMRNYIRALKPLAAYFTIHSYGQIILLPYAYKDEKPSDYSDLLSVAQKAATAIEKVNGSVYIVGTAKETLKYLALGTVLDWAKDDIGVKYSYGFELRPNQEAKSGFVLPPEQIEPTYRELFAALVVFTKEII